MREKQKYTKLQPIHNETNSLNPSLRLQKIMKARLHGLNQNNLGLKSYRWNQTQGDFLPQQKKPLSYSLESCYKIRHSTHNPKKQQNMVHSNLKTIDFKKQQIVKSLQHDILALKNLEKQLVSTRSRNSIKIKMLPRGRKNYSIDFHECCALAQRKYEQSTNKFESNYQTSARTSLLENGRRNILGNTHKIILKSLNKQEFEDQLKTIMSQNLEEITSDLDVKLKSKQRKKHRNGFPADRNKIIQEMYKRRQQQFSPWQFEQKKQFNPEFYQVFEYYNK